MYTMRYDILNVMNGWMDIMRYKLVHYLVINIEGKFSIFALINKIFCIFITPPSSCQMSHKRVTVG